MGKSEEEHHGNDSEEALILENWMRLGAMPLTATVEMGRAQISVEEAQSLKVGDVIRSDCRSTEPMRMSIEGCPRYLVRPYAAEDATSSVRIAGEIGRKRVGQRSAYRPPPRESEATR